MLPESLSPLVRVMVTLVFSTGANNPVSRFNADGRVSAAPANDRLPFGVAGGGGFGTMVAKEPAPARPGRYEPSRQEYTKHVPLVVVRFQRWDPTLALS